MNAKHFILTSLIQTESIDVDESINEDLLTLMALAIDHNNEQAVQILISGGANSVKLSTNIFQGSSIEVEDISDDPPEWALLEKPDGKEYTILDGEEKIIPKKDVFRMKRYENARKQRFDQELSMACDAEPYDFEKERLDKSPYLIRAVSHGFENLIRLLWQPIFCKESPKNMYEETALHVAVLKDYHQIVDVLLKLGHPINLCDYEGETALHNCIYGKNQQIFDILCQHKDLNINISNKAKWTALHLSILTHQQYMIDKLVALGANLNAKDKSGNTPRDLIAKVNKLHSLKLSISKVTSPVQRQQGANAQKATNPKKPDDDFGSGLNGLKGAFIKRP